MDIDTNPAPGAWVSLHYHDAEAALGYLVDVLGFREHAVYRGDADRPIVHAELLWPAGGGLMLGSDGGEGRWSGSAGAPGTSSAYLSTPDPDAVSARVADAGWRIIREIADTAEYESREFSFLDPEGNAWSVGTYRGEGF